MLFKRFITLVIVFLPAQAWCAYDIETIKTNISTYNAFKVSNWIKQDTENTWVASTSLKRVTISIAEHKAKFIAPYVNSSQKKSAKILCAEFAAIVTNSQDKESRSLIEEAIRGATTRHKMKYLTLNDIKFTVAPKLIGAVVSLHCAAKVI